jgi:signal transduction histidine kinase
MVSHDLRNLLGGIVVSAALIAEGSGEDDKGKRTLVGTTRIQRYAARMNRLIGDLLDVASIEIGTLAVVSSPADAMALIEEAVDTFQAAAAAKKITLTVDAVERPIRATFDHDRLLQVLANLLANAIKFTAEGGVIGVRGERTAAGVCVSITDNGAGIPPEMLEPVFEPFFQVGKNDRRGVGLGLYISRNIVEAHGGRIWAESTLGRGSVFSFTIPAT